MRQASNGESIKNKNRDRLETVSQTREVAKAQSRMGLAIP